MNLKNTLILGLLLSINSLFGQSVNITDADLIPLNCANFNDAATPNFFDNGGGADYGANRRDTIVVCPDLPNGPKISLVFGINAGYTFDVDASDTIYVFDGPNTSSPLLGTLNSGIDPNGGTFASSFENNPSGCLTVVFHSDAAGEGTGWDANITCGNPFQPFEPHIEAYVNGVGPNALDPIDTGYVDICFGDSILLIAKPIFPYSLEANGFGYSQNLENMDYEWTFSNGVTGANNDSIWFRPNVRGGFYLGLIITDQFPQLQQIACKIRVSQLPNFNGTGAAVNPICAYDQGLILGGVSSIDTVGVDIPPGSFDIGGTVAGLTYLPDGSGQEYSTTITMGGFPDGATFGPESDLQNICLTMEHSYLGDLEVWLECPDGTEVALINSYDPGHIAGGFDGGGTFLGDADDFGNGTPGVGFEYCFSSVNSTFGTMGDELAGGNTVPTDISSGEAMNPDGVYLPESSFGDFNGCPLNGDWTIHVRDNLAIDDGYIFEWGLYFDASLFPETESYLNYIVEDHWEADPTIVGTASDTAIVVLPNFPGTYDYTFVVTDDFGCVYDTTVNITVRDTIDLIPDFSICDSVVDFTLNIGTDGVWSNVNSTLDYSIVDDTDVNTTITFQETGIYNMVYTQNGCPHIDDTIRVFKENLPFFDLNSDFFNCPGQTELLVVNDSTGLSSITWDASVPQFDDIFRVRLNQGTYNATITTILGCSRDTTFTITSQPEIITANYADLCDLELDMTLNTPIPFGSWSQISGPSTAVFGSTTDINTSVTVTEYGTYSFKYSETNCNDADTVTVSFLDVPTVSTSNYSNCEGAIVVAQAVSNVGPSSLTWSNGTTGNTTQITESGTYTVTAQNICGTSQATSNVNFVICELDMPNVFTPGDNTTNEIFKVLEANDVFDIFHVQIFNRWGNLMYEYFDVFGGWDGKTSNGDDASEGVYFYKLNAVTFSGKEISLDGFLHLVRNK